MHDVIIIGGGPAGLAAMAYAIRKRLDALLISPGLGGRTNRRLLLPWVKDYQVMLGEEVVQRFRTQIEYLDFMRVRTTVSKVEPLESGGYCVTVADGKQYETQAVLLATGSVGETLDVPGEAEFEMKGLCYNTATYAPLFIDRSAIVVGDGLQALRAVAELQRVAQQVTLIAETEGALQTPLGQRLQREDNVEVMVGYRVTKILGDKFVRSVTIQRSDESVDLETEAIFVEKGMIPNTGLLANLVEMDEHGMVVVDPFNRTSRPGIYAAGDVTTTYSDQLLISVGEGAKALLSIYDDLLGVR